MIIKSGISGAQIEITDAPKITYSGDWMPWRPEFYKGTLYWEAWFLRSGTLTVESGMSYKADAWGIGGGSQAGWTSGGGQIGNTYAGVPNMRTNLTLSGDIKVTIGEGGMNDGSSAKGNDTKLGDLLTCAGGAAPEYNGSVTDSYKRYRFEDSDKKDEEGRNTSSKTLSSTTFYAQGGWLHIRRTIATNEDNDGASTAQGEGFGGGGCYHGWSAPGALVIRILA